MPINETKRKKDKRTVCPILSSFPFRAHVLILDYEYTQMICLLGTKRNYEKSFQERVIPKSRPISFVNISCKRLKLVNTVGSGTYPPSLPSPLSLEIAKGEVERNTGSAQMVETNVNTDMLSHLVSYSNRKRRRKKPTQRNKKSRSKNSSKSK